MEIVFQQYVPVSKTKWIKSSDVSGGKVLNTEFVLDLDNIEGVDEKKKHHDKTKIDNKNPAPRIKIDYTRMDTTHILKLRIQKKYNISVFDQCLFQVDSRGRHNFKSYNIINSNTKKQVDFNLTEIFGSNKDITEFSHPDISINYRFMKYYSFDEANRVILTSGKEYTNYLVDLNKLLLVFGVQLIKLLRSNEYQFRLLFHNIIRPMFPYYSFNEFASKIVDNVISYEQFDTSFLKSFDKHVSSIYGKKFGQKIIYNSINFFNYTYKSMYTESIIDNYLLFNNFETDKNFQKIIFRNKKTQALEKVSLDYLTRDINFKFDRNSDIIIFSYLSKMMIIFNIDYMGNIYTHVKYFDSSVKFLKLDKLLAGVLDYVNKLIFKINDLNIFMRPNVRLLPVKSILNLNIHNIHSEFFLNSKYTKTFIDERVVSNFYSSNLVRTYDNNSYIYSPNGSVSSYLPLMDARIEDSFSRLHDKIEMRRHVSLFRKQNKVVFKLNSSTPSILVTNVYQQEFDGVERICNFMFHYIINNSKLRKKTTAITNKSTTFSGKLSNFDPILFTELKNKQKYSRLCQKNFQPVIISEDQERKTRDKSKIAKYRNFTNSTTAYYYCPRANQFMRFMTGKHKNGYCLPCCGVKQDKIGKKTQDKIDQCKATLTYKESSENDEINQRYIQSFSKNIQPGEMKVVDARLLQYLKLTSPTEFSKVKIIKHLVSDDSYTCLLARPQATSSTYINILPNIAMAVDESVEAVAKKLMRHNVKIQGVPTDVNLKTYYSLLINLDYSPEAMMKINKFEQQYYTSTYDDIFNLNIVSIISSVREIYKMEVLLIIDDNKNRMSFFTDDTNRDIIIIYLDTKNSITYNLQLHNTTQIFKNQPSKNIFEMETFNTTAIFDNVKKTKDVENIKLLVDDMDNVVFALSPDDYILPINIFDPHDISMIQEKENLFKYKYKRARIGNVLSLLKKKFKPFHTIHRLGKKIVSLQNNDYILHIEPTSGKIPYKLLCDTHITIQIPHDHIDILTKVYNKSKTSKASTMKKFENSIYKVYIYNFLFQEFTRHVLTTMPNIERAKIRENRIIHPEVLTDNEYISLLIAKKQGKLGDFLKRIVLKVDIVDIINKIMSNDKTLDEMINGVVKVKPSNPNTTNIVELKSCDKTAPLSYCDNSGKILITNNIKKQFKKILRFIYSNPEVYQIYALFYENFHIKKQNIKKTANEHIRSHFI